MSPIATATGPTRPPGMTGPPVLMVSSVLEVIGASGLVMAVSGVLLLTLLAALYNQVAVVTAGLRVTLVAANPAGLQAVADPARHSPAVARRFAP